jgi:outer membrane biosynthesis protein TonB
MSGLSWEIPISTFLHMVVFGLVVVVGQCTHASTPLFKDEDVMVVEMAGPAMLASRMPQKAERTPDVARGDPTPSNEPPPNPDQMRFQTPDAPKAKGDATADAEREALINEMRKQQALKDLSAPLGTNDRAASSPEGTANPDGATSSGVNDPELARWVKATRDVVLPNWHPVRTYCVTDPDLSVQASVSVGPDGSLTDKPKIVRPSGNASIDASMLRAIELTGRFPPPPAKYASGLTGTVQMKCKDIL